MKGNCKVKKRRPIEREYLATLNGAVPLDTWQAICKRAADDALAGDARARDWLAKWLLATDTRPLTTLVAEEFGTTLEAAAESELTARRQKIEDGQREAEQHRQLFESLYSQGLEAGISK